MKLQEFINKFINDEIRAWKTGQNDRLSRIGIAIVVMFIMMFFIFMSQGFSPEEIGSLLKNGR